MIELLNLHLYIGFTGGRVIMSARDAIKQFSVNLNCELSLENDIFFAMAVPRRRGGQCQTR